MTVLERAQAAFKRHPELRLLFLFDPDGEYRQEIEEWDEEASGILCVEATPATFTLKVRLEHELADKNVLLYAAHPRPRGEALGQYHLADLLFANRELLLDPVADFMDEYGIEQRHLSWLKPYYAGELRYKNRQEVLASLLRTPNLDEVALKRGLASYHLGFRTVKNWNGVLAGVMANALDSGAFETFERKAEELDLHEELGKRLAGVLQLEKTEFSYEQVVSATQKLKYNLLLRTIETANPEDPYRDLRLSGTGARHAFAAFVTEWQRDRDLDDRLPEVLSTLAADVDEMRLLEAYGPGTRFGFYTPRLGRAVTHHVIDLVAHQPRHALEVLAELEQGRGEETATDHVHELLVHVASYYSHALGVESFVFSSPEAYVRAYADELHRADFHYRKAVLHHHAAQESSQPIPDELRAAYEAFLRHYHDAFVKPLNVEWLRVLRENGFRLNDIDVAHLHEFYRGQVQETDQKTAVIISDALRYEVAQELRGALLADPRKTATLQPALAPVPSVTSLGMASLLPHTELHLKGEQVCIDGRSTAGLKNRLAILQQANPEATAVTYRSVRDMDRATGRQLFKDHKVVYIYHNRIDAEGDDRKTEKGTAEAAEKAIAELEALVKTINNWNVYRVLMTADHGFQYTEDEVSDAMHEPFPKAEGEVMKNNRSIVAEAFPDLAPEDVMRLAEVSGLRGDLAVAVPKAVNRYRLSGSGKHYVHGGASLQELVVPVLEVLKAREEKADKVGVRLLTDRDVISSSVLPVDLLQVEPVSSNRKAREVSVGLYDEQKEPVSDEVTVELGETAADPLQRKMSVVLTLNARANELNFCHLRVFDTEDRNRLNPLVDRSFTIKRLIEHDDFS